MVFAKSHATGLFPADWKLANVTPVFKKGSQNQPWNYRPISLTSVPCKLMENILKERMVQLFEAKHFFFDYQHGFTKDRSSLTNLLETLEPWTAALDEGFGIDVIYLDYRKAFNMVTHNILIYKLKSLGIDSNLLSSLTDFLSARYMRVCLWAMWKSSSKSNFHLGTDTSAF